MITQAIHYLNEYANTLSDDENFKEFAKALYSFSEKIKYEKNINDKNTFIEELQKEVLKNYENDKAYKDFFFIQASALALEMESKFYIDMQAYHKNFQKAYEALKENLEFDEEKEELISELLQNLDFNENLSLEKEENNQKINAYENALSNEGFIAPAEDEFKDEQKIKPSELISFIKDENQITYPFDRKATLNNASFMRGFKKELNHLGTKELESMIKAMRAKNEALRKELDSLKSKKESLLKELRGEINHNAILSLVKDNKELHPEVFNEENLKQETSNPKNTKDENDENELYEKMAQIQAQNEQKSNDESLKPSNFKRKK